jgi:hypothetical protein
MIQIMNKRLPYQGGRFLLEKIAYVAGGLILS